MAIETNGGTWVNVNSNDDKGHVNVYGSDPKNLMMNQYMLILIIIIVRLQLMKNLME